jgi:hypothetical protein
MAGVIVCASGSTIQYEKISARDILDKAANSPMIYDHVVVIGDLELKNNEYKEINITNSLIEGNASFSGSTFSGGAIFRNTTFLKAAEFAKSRFNGEADFNHSHFCGAANFSESRFIEGATFDYTTFDKTADFSVNSFEKSGSFSNAIFAGDALFFLSQFNGVYANFESTQFLKNVDFDSITFSTFLSFAESKIDKNADFHGCRFGDRLNFLNSTFLGYTNFARCHFTEESNFRGIRFNNTSDFSNAKFDGPSFFNNTKFYGNAIFDGAQFLGPSDFSYAQFDKNIAMNNTKISTMVLERANFNPTSHLFLAKADINRLMVKWSQIKDIFFFDTSAYLSLVKNYRDMGTSDADDCYYQFRSLTQDSRSWGWAKILDILANITCGYGVRADRPVICSLFLVLGCTVILWVGRGLRSPTIKDKTTSFYDALYYCLAVFFTIPLPDLKPAGKYRYVSVTLRAIGWTLFALLIATLGKVMIK